MKGPILTGEKIDLSKFEKKKREGSVFISDIKKGRKEKKKKEYLKTIIKTISLKKKSTQMDNVKIQKKIAETLDKLTNKGKSSSVKFRKQKREERRESS